MTTFQEEDLRRAAIRRSLSSGLAPLGYAPRLGRWKVRRRPGALVLAARRAWWWVCWAGSWPVLAVVAVWSASGPIGTAGRRR